MEAYTQNKGVLKWYPWGTIATNGTFLLTAKQGDNVLCYVRLSVGQLQVHKICLFAMQGYAG